MTTCKPFAERARENYLRVIEKMALMNTCGTKLTSQRAGCIFAWSIHLHDGMIAWYDDPETGEPYLHVTCRGLQTLRESGYRYWPEKYIDFRRLMQNADQILCTL